MYVFDLDWHYNRLIVALSLALIVAPITTNSNTNHVHSSVPYQWAIYPKYDRRGHASPSEYGPGYFHFGHSLGEPVCLPWDCMCEIDN